MVDHPPANTPIRARHPGRPNPTPHLKRREAQLLQRPNEPLQLARHGLAGVRRPDKPVTPEGDGA